MTLVWLKALHIIALSVWCAGLIMTPTLLARHGPGGHHRGFERLRRLTRFSFTAIVSPAAVIAIGAGSGLIFMADVMTGWMALKLALVGGMAAIHVEMAGLISRLSDPACEISKPQAGLRIAIASLLISGVLIVVLAKPVIDSGLFPDWLLTPGAGQSFWSARSTPT